jgi:hypothetical protein
MCMCIYIKTNNIEINENARNYFLNNGVNILSDSLLEFNLKDKKGPNEREIKCLIVIINLSKVEGTKIGFSNAKAIYKCMRYQIPLFLIINKNNEALIEEIKKSKCVSFSDYEELLFFFESNNQKNKLSLYVSTYEIILEKITCYKSRKVYRTLFYNIFSNYIEILTPGADANA